MLTNLMCIEKNTNLAKCLFLNNNNINNILSDTKRLFGTATISLFNSRS